MSNTTKHHDMNLNLEEILKREPKYGCCRECHVSHESDGPHSIANVVYQVKFYADNGRLPVWSDAIRHLPKLLRDAWMGEAMKQGKWSEPDHPDPCHVRGTIGKLTVGKIIDSRNHLFGRVSRK